MAGMAIDMSRHYKGLKDSIEILKTLRDPKITKSKKWTPYEGVPVSVPPRKVRKTKNSYAKEERA
jgi:hypothetical protein